MSVDDDDDDDDSLIGMTFTETAKNVLCHFLSHAKGR